MSQDAGKHLCDESGDLSSRVAKIRCVLCIASGKQICTGSGEEPIPFRRRERRAWPRGSCRGTRPPSLFGENTDEKQERLEDGEKSGHLFLRQVTGTTEEHQIENVAFSMCTDIRVDNERQSTEFRPNKSKDLVQFENLMVKDWSKLAPSKDRESAVC